MKLHSLIVDDFLDDFAGWRAWADTLDYVSIENPADSVSYPGIFKEMPTWGLTKRLSAVMRAEVRLKALFMRLSLKGVPVPHQAHNDAVMGDYSLMIYMNRREHCSGGTELVRHAEGMDGVPRNAIELNTWQNDTNRSEMWTAYSQCEMRPNRAFIFDASLMHRAIPIGGFGTDATNGRLVMTAFFNL